MTKERPIIFSAPMVRAILDGRKTQTRRIVKQRLIERYERGELGLIHNGPYGKPGDSMWVRETHLVRGAGAVVDYRADMDLIDAAGHGAFYGGWNPSMFMRREHSRITLEVTGVRVERLHDISEEDAKAEGATGDCPIGYIPAYQAGPHSYHFAQIWESINGPGSWEANPFVWVVTFKRVKP